MGFELGVWQKARLSLNQSKARTLGSQDTVLSDGNTSTTMATIVDPAFLPFAGQKSLTLSTDQSSLILKSVLAKLRRRTVALDEPDSIKELGGDEWLMNARIRSTLHLNGSGVEWIGEDA